MPGSQLFAHKEREDDVGEGLIIVCGLLINHFFFLALGLTLALYSTWSLWVLSFSSSIFPTKIVVFSWCQCPVQGMGRRCMWTFYAPLMIGFMTWAFLKVLWSESAFFWSLSPSLSCSLPHHAKYMNHLSIASLPKYVKNLLQWCLLFSLYVSSPPLPF